MDIERGNLEILFRWMPIEYITYRETDVSKKNDCFEVNRYRYLEECHRVFPFLSGDEHKSAYSLMNMQMRYKKCYPKSIFQLIVGLAEKFITYRFDSLLCRYRQLLRWREISLHLGQDFFICAFLADYDIQWNIQRKRYNWNPVLFCDNDRISSLLHKGIAENHFHLKGSSQIFNINWIALMNHPLKKEFRKSFRNIKKTLHSQQSNWQTRGEQLYEQCIKAALYRIYLFSSLMNDSYLHNLVTNVLHHDYRLYTSELQSAIEYARWKYGMKFMKGDCLDYALTPDICDKDKNKTPVPFAGERSFLYLCYKACLLNKFKPDEQRLYYLYLKSCIDLREEIIQSNNFVGFDNFADYQSRKKSFIIHRSIYEEAFYQSAIIGGLYHNYVKSLEVRITPEETVKELVHSIKYNDKYVSQFQHGKIRAHYVIHFQKKPDSSNSFGACRNGSLRFELKKYAQTMVHAMELVPELQSRIVGIDACASEIGCRPEVFGQLYRYLQQVPFSRGDERKKITHLAATYHVGEDFFDIVDGLRAIDEVIHFCGFHRGDRIGHGLALGLGPEEYYKTRAYTILLPKQVLLDDIMWMIHYSHEWPCSKNGVLQDELLSTFQSLYHEIYNTCGRCNYNLYFNSWLLRGDNPELYLGSYDDFINKINRMDKELDHWNRLSLNKLSRNRKNVRESKEVFCLVKEYFYNNTVKVKGNEITEFHVNKEYINLVYTIQDKMMENLSEMGIGIETNPSSNYLIGRIMRYDQHPILRFNARKLTTVQRNHSLSVSINTDDMGIFDTSLENEYALMALALEKAIDGNGNLKYDREAIYAWLDYVREMGIEQSFQANMNAYFNQIK